MRSNPWRSLNSRCRPLRELAAFLKDRIVAVLASKHAARVILKSNILASLTLRVPRRIEV